MQHRSLSELSRPQRAPVVLVIAESDPSGSAGIQGDLTSLAALGLYGAAVPTCLTVRGRGAVRSAQPLPAAITGDSLRALLDDMPVDAVKIGLLPNLAVMRTVERALRGFAGPIVLDPVTHRVHRQRFAQESQRDFLLERLLPRATVVTPNLKAASALCRHPVGDLELMVAAARALVGAGARCALVKGGGLPDDPVDALVDAERFALLWGRRRPGSRTRGGGSLISVAIAAALATGAEPRVACIDARVRLDRVLSSHHPIGEGTPSIAHHALRGLATSDPGAR